MPIHYWGDEDFDWDSLYKAEKELRHTMKRYGRIGVHSKEKYGTLRFSIYFCDGTLHSFTHPGYVRSQYPKWLWCFDLDYRPLKLFKPLINFWQKLIVKYAFTKTCNKYPHIVQEIVMNAPDRLLPPYLELIRAKLWTRSCKKCEEWNTTDLIYCKSCGKNQCAVNYIREGVTHYRSGCDECGRKKKKLKP